MNMTFLLDNKRSNLRKRTRRLTASSTKMSSITIWPPTLMQRGNRLPALPRVRQKFRSLISSVRTLMFTHIELPPTQCCFTLVSWPRNVPVNTYCGHEVPPENCRRYKTLFDSLVSTQYGSSNDEVRRYHGHLLRPVVPDGEEWR